MLDRLGDKAGSAKAASAALYTGDGDKSHTRILGLQSLGKVQYTLEE